MIQDSLLLNTEERTQSTARESILPASRMSRSKYTLFLLLLQVNFTNRLVSLLQYNFNSFTFYFINFGPFQRNIQNLAGKSPENGGRNVAACKMTRKGTEMTGSARGREVYRSLPSLPCKSLGISDGNRRNSRVCFLDEWWFNWEWLWSLT